MKVCVFCSSSNHIDEKYNVLARELGSWLSKNGFDAVYGGTGVGLMEKMAEGFQAVPHTGKLIGVIPQKIIDMGLKSSLPDEMVEVADMKDRKAYMREIGEAFIAMPGSFGTLDEIIEEIVLKQLDYHQKPVIFLDPFGFYKHMYAQFETFFEEGFTHEHVRKYYVVAETVEVLKDCLK